VMRPVYFCLARVARCSLAQLGDGFNPDRGGYDGLSLLLRNAQSPWRTGWPDGKDGYGGTHPLVGRWFRACCQAQRLYPQAILYSPLPNKIKKMWLSSI